MLARSRRKKAAVSQSKVMHASLSDTHHALQDRNPDNADFSVENVKSYAKIPGPFSLPIVGNLLSFASFTPKTHLTWTSWAKTFGKIYK